MRSSTLSSSWTIHRRCFFTGFTTLMLMWLLAIGLTFGQAATDQSIAAGPDQTSTPEGTSESDTQATPAERKIPDFATIVRKIKSNDREINRLFSSMPIGFPARQAEFKQKIKQLERETEMLRSMLDEAALESFRKSPGENPAAVQLVMNNLIDLLEAKSPDASFDPHRALEIVDVLMNGGGDKSPIVLFQAFRAKYATEDFQGARAILDKITELGPTLTSQIEAVDATAEIWRRELMIRRLEQNNDDLPRVKFETTAGDFVVELFEDHAPNTVANFVSLVEKNFYNNLVFHAVKPGEFSATGCPNGDGSGSPGYSIESEFDREKPRDFFAGTLGMLNTGQTPEGKKTAGSQFFITHQPDSQLNSNFTAFGRVIEGFEVVRSMKRFNASDYQPQFGSNDSDEAGPVKITRAEMVRKRGHEYQPQKVVKAASPDMFGIPGFSDGLPNPDGDSPASPDATSVDGLPSAGDTTSTSNSLDDLTPVNSGVFNPVP